MKKITSLLLVVLFAGSVYAQKPNPFSAKTADVSKIKVMYDFPPEGKNAKNGSGYSANMELVNPKPKKVALIGFYLYDPGVGKSSNNGSSITTKAWRTSEVIGQGHIDGFYAKGIDQLKASFKENGIDLLTPDEFLDTDDKKEAFYGFEQESGKKIKTERTMWGKQGVNVTLSSLKICPSDKGYRPFFVVNEQVNECTPSNFKTAGVLGANRKMTSSLGYELAQELGVDAVVVFYIVTRKPKEFKSDYGVNAINLYMFGPNPVSKGEDDKNRGQFFCGTRVFYGSPLLFQTSKGGAASFDGIENVMKAMTNKMMDYVFDKK